MIQRKETIMSWLHKTLVCLVIVFVTVSNPVIGRAADVDELKTSVDQLIGALNKKDLEAWSPLVHDHAVGFGLIAPFPADNKVALRQGFQGLFASMESFTIVPLNWQYRTVGDSGFAWGHVMVTFKQKDGPTRILWGREIMTWAKVGGKWQMLTVHASPIPADGL
jgi:ketosteroid isomerase-like protein